MSTPRWYHSATLLDDGRVLVAGGISNNGIEASTELYDPATNTWTPSGAMATARHPHTATALGRSRLLVTGGRGASSAVLASAEVYFAIPGGWGPAGTLGTARSSHTATLLGDGRVLVTSGIDAASNYLASAELYSGMTNIWSPAQSMSTTRYQDAAVALNDGRALVIGGLDQASGQLATTLLFNPATSSWSPGGSMAGPRSPDGHAAVLADGSVLVAGGYDSGFILSTTERYDPASNTWSSAGILGTRRVGATVTALNSGQALIVGGAGPNFFKLASAELWTREPVVGLSLSPPSSSGLVNSAHTVTATVTEDGAAMGGRPVVFTVSGANTRGPTPVTTNGAGQASFNYTASNAGTDTITASYVDTAGIPHTSNSVSRTWTIATITLAPPTASGRIFSSHTVTATLTEGGSAVNARAVTFRVTSGPNTGKTATTDSNNMGMASWQYSGSATGTDTITATFTDAAGQPHSASAQRTWTAPVVGLTLTPGTSSGLVNSSHTVTATVTEDGLAAKSRPVVFNVSGANPRSVPVTTNDMGQAAFNYTATNAGNDTITASYVDTVGITHSSNSVSRTWTIATISLAPPTDTGPIAGTHTVTATLTEGGIAVNARAVTFLITSGPNTGKTATTNSNNMGKASWPYSGSVTGTDTITATFTDSAGQPHSATAQRIWTTPLVGLSLTPANSSGLVNSSHTVTATVTEDGLAAKSRPVVFNVSGANPRSVPVTTNDMGQAAFNYTATNAGNDTITAGYLDTVGLPHTSNSVSRTWTIATITLAPPTSTGQIAGTHTVTATLTEGGIAVDARAVTFRVISGPNNGKTGTTNSNPAGNTSWPYSGSVTGIDTITATFTDSAGQPHAATAQRTWTNVIPAPADRDLDGVADAQDNCPDAANGDQADRDADAIGNVCDTALPPGDLPVEVGRVARVKEVSGEVLVRLASNQTGLRRTLARQVPTDRFVPLKGVATIPIGSLIDARNGTLELTTAANSSTRAVRIQRGRFAAALFTLRQVRRLRPTTDLVLQTPAGMARACAPRRPNPVRSHVVRTLVGSGEGLFRTVGAASTTLSTRGAWTVNDRCDGTLTIMSTGTATVRDHRTGRNDHAPARAPPPRPQLSVRRHRELPTTPVGVRYEST